MDRIRTTILIDNISRREDMMSEWGLAMLIEFRGKKILLDTGAGPSFASNARSLGLDLSEVDIAVISHAHYDHTDGMEAFFTANAEAPMYLSQNACENCYHISDSCRKYDGIKQGWLERFADRIIYAGTGVTEIADGVYLVPHTTPHLEEIGAKVGQYVKKGGSYFPDDYSHEQSLVFVSDEGMAVYNSCSHGGVDNIIREAKEAFPGLKVRCMTGGFHLFMFSEEEVREQAERIAETGIEHIITGHCTGDEQYVWLADELAKHGVRTDQMESGLVTETEI